MRAQTAAAWGIGMLSLAGCNSTAPVATVQPPVLLIETEAVSQSRFAAGAAILSGFDALEPGEWKVGDSVLLGIGMDRPGKSKELYMRVTALPKWPEIRVGEDAILFRDSLRVRYSGHDSRPDGGWVRVEYDLVPLQVELYDERGKLIFETISMMPEMCLRYGLIDNIELERSGGSFYDELPVLEEGKDQMAGERQLRLLSGWIALMRLPQFLHRDSMQGLVWETIDRPSLLSIVRSGGISLGLSMKPQDAELVEPPPLGAGPVYRVPLVVQVNDRPAMDCTLLLAQAIPPLGPCNGLLAMEAVNPTDARKRLTIQLLAARRDQIPESLKQRAMPLPSTPPAAGHHPAEPAEASPGGSDP